MTEESSTWTPAKVREWVDRHGGPVAAAQRLQVTRTALHYWTVGERPIPPYIVAHMETINQLEAATRAPSSLAEVNPRPPRDPDDVRMDYAIDTLRRTQENQQD